MEGPITGSRGADMSHTYYVKVPFAGAVNLAVESEERLDKEALWNAALEQANELSMKMTFEDGDSPDAEWDWHRHVVRNYIRNYICFANFPDFVIDDEEHVEEDE